VEIGIFLDYSFFALCILLADQISSGIIKNAVQRLRPSREETISGWFIW
jgi:hypothetical protein